jgi:hypothetical protein
MSNLTRAFENEMDALARVRDELRLQVHLGGAEARDTFAHLERRWVSLQEKATELQAQAGDGAQTVAAAAHSIADEIRLGYEEIRRRMAQG